MTESLICYRGVELLRLAVISRTLRIRYEKGAKQSSHTIKADTERTTRKTLGFQA